MLLKRPVATIILILAVFIFGGIALSNLSVSLLPKVETPTLMVRTNWSGAAPREIEQRINKTLEAVLGTVQGVKHIHGFARQGRSVISLQFQWGQDMDLAFLNVREKLDQVRYALPPAADRPQLVHNSSSDLPIAVLGVSTTEKKGSDFATSLSLKRWSKQVLAQRLEQADGIAQAVLVGGVQPEVKIKYRPKALSRYGFTLGQIQSRIQQANLFTATGELRNGWYRYSLKIQSQIQSLDDIRSVPLLTLGNGKVLTISDVANVELGPADPTSFALVDGKPMLSVLVKKSYGTNTVKVFDSMLPLLRQLRKQNPDVHIQVLSENASFIRNSIHNLMSSLVIGAILAFLVLFFFLDDYRTPFTVGISIPVSIFVTFFVMYLAGIQLNIISLSGLTLATGMLVDNAIIVLENINRYREQGYGILTSASKGTREVLLSVSASTFTSISVFLPLVFLSGFQGAFFKEQAWTLSISLLASLVVALLILPVLVVQVNKKNKKHQPLGLSQYVYNVRRFYDRSLKKGLQHSYWWTGLFFLIAVFSVYEFASLSKGIFPESPPVQLRYQVRLPGNTSLSSTRRAAAALMRILPNSNEKPAQVRGGYTDRTNLSKLSKEGLNTFVLTVPVSGYAQAHVVQQKIDQFSDRRPGWSVKPLSSNSALRVLPSVGKPPIIFRLVGKDRKRSERLAPLLQAKLQQVNPSLTLQKQYQQQVKTYRLHFKQNHLLRLGITERDVIGYLTTLTRGKLVTDWVRRDENVDIRLMGIDRRIYDPRNITIHDNGKIIPLSYLASIQTGREAEQLEEVNQTPVLSYMANLNPTQWWHNKSEIKDVALQFTRQTGTQVKIGGATITITSLFKKLGLLLLISVVIIYIIMAVQFESLKLPFLIMFAVPFGWIGAVTMLWLAGVSLNVFSFMGILILTGIAVNDAILKVDFMQRYYGETGDLVMGIRMSGHVRFRPVVMTGVTTICGLIPMLLPIGQGYAFRQSLALALMGGMVTSTVVTLYLVPMIFQWMEGSLTKAGEKLGLNWGGVDKKEGQELLADSIIDELEE